MTNGETLKIGCKIYKASEWFAFSDTEIGNMDHGALDWWKSHKPLIKSLVKQHNDLEKSALAK